MKNSLINQSIFNVIKNNIGISALLVFSVIGVIITSLVPPHILKYIIDNNFIPKKYDNIILLAVLYILFTIFIGIFDFLKEVLLTIIGQRFTKEIRYNMIKKLERINYYFFSTNETGAIVSRFTNDVNAINTLFTGGIVGMFIDCFKIIGIVLSICFFSYKLGVIVFLLLPVIYVITRLFQRRMLKAQIDNRILIGKINNHISESFKNIRMIKSYSKEKYMENNYVDYLLKNYQTVEKVNLYDSLYSPMILVIRSIVICLIVILSSSQLDFLGITLGMVAASIDFISNLFAPIESLGMELQNIQTAVSGINRVNNFFDQQEDENKDVLLNANDILKDSAMIKFNHVDFHYSGDIDILNDINLIINPQEKVTFAGRTGIGKSTLFKLIMGIIKPTKGSITINNIDVYTIPNSQKRRIFGFVSQNLHIIKGTIADQISLKDDDISREQIISALDFVGLWDYINSLEKGIDTKIINDSLFSQGQKQLLAIARAIVTNPPILLLDEITANLDSITEKKIVNVLQKASTKHTILSISHRLSSMISSDTIVILENGRIKHQGSPEVILETDDWYRSHIALENLTWN